MLGFQKRGKLHQPRRSLHGQRLDKGFSPWTTTQPTERLQHRVVRFLATVAFHALPAGNANGEYVGGSPSLEFVVRVHHALDNDLVRPESSALLQDYVDQRGFSDARLPRDKDDLPLPPHGLTKTAVQLG